MKQRAEEDYLRAIYLIYEKQTDKSPGIKSVDIAKELKVSKPSVSEMVKKLAKKGLVSSKPYSNIFLTEKGMKEARRITHSHRLIEFFLKNILGCKKEEVHEYAHKLEHAFSEDLIKKLDNFLKNPRVCPHGDLMHPWTEKRLSELKTGETGIVKSIEGHHGFQRRLHSLGVRVCKSVTMTSSHPFGGPVVIRVDGMRIVIGRGMASRIIVSIK